MRKAACAIGIAVLALIAAAPRLLAADDSTAVDATRQTLLYGIDSQVLDAVQRLSSNRDGRFTKELVTVLQEARSIEVRKAILGLFEDQGLKDGVDAARGIIGSPDEQGADILVASIHYLSTVGATGLAQLLAPLIDSPDAGVASAAIRAAGKAGDSSTAALLEKKLSSPDFPDARKADVILSLGDLKDANAVEALIAIAKNTDEDKFQRLYAADALGKIGDKKAVPVLKAMFAEKDALVRAYAASALSRFSLEEAFPMLMQGLKDDDPRVREQCARAMTGKLSAGQEGAALPALAYKAQYDPAPQVRAAAIQALASLGSGGAADTLVKLYQTAGSSLDAREAALKALASRSVSRALDASQQVIMAEWKSVDQRSLEMTARVLSALRGSELKEAYVKFLGSTDAVVRAYAVRGIGTNGFSDLKDRIKDLPKTDPSPLVRAEAERALGKL
ncbi:MAG TPA: HEAT repeat domain-containing protein [Spirochaetia bacterium]|nr:HEAT repeat domain-containing protein [Spirochaetia bacterium]